MNSDFDAPDLLELLETSPIDDFDELDFGVITMDRSGIVTGYNTHESERAGLPGSKVLGRNFFETVGPCTNNYLIRQRYIDEPDLDDFLDYVFTLRMAPTPVRLRMLSRAGSDRQYLIVRFR